MIIYLLHGQPKHGKTTIAQYFNCEIVQTDEIFLQLWNDITGIDNRGNFSIYHTLSKLNQVQIDVYYNRLLSEITKQRCFELLVDGWLLQFFLDRLKKDLSNYKVVDILVFEKCCYIDGVKFHNNSEDTIKDVVLWIKQYVLKQLPINYHYFEDLNIGNPLQPSKAKYESFNIKPSGHVLDIGCNTGYNCFRMSQTAVTVTGIDISKEAIQAAETVNDVAYYYSNVLFKQADIMAYIPGIEYEIILASSMFHYMPDKKAFIDKCYLLLQMGGILCLECGILSDGVTQNRKDCTYTTEEELLKFADNFMLAAKYKSIDQAGDTVPRWVYHLMKI